MPLITEEQAADSKRTTTTTYCQRFRAEVNPCGKGGWFTTTDPATGRTININDSFAFVPVLFSNNNNNNSNNNNNNVVTYALTLLWKVLIVAFGWATVVLGMTVRKGKLPQFFFAYLSNWGVTVCSIYLSFSLINLVLAFRKQQQDDTTDKVSWRILLTWVTFIIGIHTTAVATLLYWNLIYDPEDTVIRFITVAAHGGLFVLLALDGLVLNRIPIRVMHWISILVPFDLVFILWSIVHDLGTDIGNPDNNDNDTTTNDDAIYQGVLEWGTKPATATKWTIICVFVIGLLLFYIIWTLSTYVGGDRLRYNDNEQPQKSNHQDATSNYNNNKVDDEEEATSQELHEVTTE